MLPKVQAAESLAICNIHPVDYTNNIVEFVDEIILGNEDQKPDNENDSPGFEIEESADYYFQHDLFRVEHGKFHVNIKEQSTHASDRLTIPCFEKVSPPPEA